MILSRRLFAAFATALMFSPAAAVPPKKPVDWTRTVVATPEGGFRMGNPAAKVKLVEYGSLTCPHCRHFAETGMAPLMAYVKRGKVSFEYRSFILNGVDVSASLVARCGGASRFFPMVERFYATQSDWGGKLAGMSDAEKRRLSGLSDGERLVAIANAGGFQKIAAASGLPVAQANKCLTDSKAFERIGEIYEKAVSQGVQGTPTFFVNGTKVNAGDWSSLEPVIKKAGG